MPAPDRHTRPWYLTMLLVVAIAGPLFAVPTALMGRDELMRQFPKLSSTLLSTQVVFAALGVAGAVTILLARRIGLWFVLASGAGVVATDLLYESWVHAGVAAALTTALGLATRAHWPHLR
ncbi:MAG: hypothetical protein HZB39_21230 [Planctomycetes bacterium]|nr:hypothetical protein [Planctomycetota bacterium]